MASQDLAEIEKVLASVEETANRITASMLAIA
jgi:hypothetical protein